MSDTLKIFVAGLVGVMMVTAVGLHAQQLAQLPKPTGSALQGVIGVAEKG